MEITIQKYGGSSLADDRQLFLAADRVARVHRRGMPIVVVVSARGDTTDELVDAAATISPAPDPAETDKLLATGEQASAALLAIALREQGVPAVSLSGPQAGLRAVGRHGLGVVATVDLEPVRGWLARNHVVVVAGFQASDENGDLITLGRGGSDTSAVALAVAHGASVCEIYTDVDGVRRADPRVVADAAALAEVDAELMTEMAFSGARVLHPRAVELAAAHGVDIVVRHFGRPGAGSTIIGRRTRMSASGPIEERAGVVAVTHDPAVVQLVVTSTGRPEPCGVAVLDALAEHQIVVDSVVWQSSSPHELRLACCVPEIAAAAALSAVDSAVSHRGGSAYVRDAVGKVSVVGTGLLSRPGLTALALRVLTERGIDAECVSATQSRTTFLLPRERVDEAVTALYRRLGLDRVTGSDPVATDHTFEGSPR